YGSQGALKLQVQQDSTPASPPSPQAHDNGNGTTTAYVDSNGNGQQDSDEPGATTPTTCASPSIGANGECHTANLCASGYGLQVDGSPTCVGSVMPTGVRECSSYNTLYTPTPYPGQDNGVVLE